MWQALGPMLPHVRAIVRVRFFVRWVHTMVWIWGRGCFRVVFGIDAVVFFVEALVGEAGALRGAGASGAAGIGVGGGGLVVVGATGVGVGRSGLVMVGAVAVC